MAMASAAPATMCASVSAAHFCSAAPRRRLSSRSKGGILGIQCKVSQQSWTSASTSAAAGEKRPTSELRIVSSARAGFRSDRAGGSSRGGKVWTDWRRPAVAEQLQSETETEENSAAAIPSDFISIFFEAEGSLPEASVTKLTATLEGVEGVSDVDVRASSDGTATVKLTKQMNVQATGVASGLVEVLINGGFKVQALNLGVDEDDGNGEDIYDYDIPTTTDETESVE